MSPELVPVFALIIFAASFVQGSTGFGFALVAVSGLSLFTPLTHATPLLVLLNIPVTMYLFLRLRKALVWRDLAPLMLGVLSGVPVGVYVLVHWSEGVLLRILAVVLVVAVVRSLRAKRDNDDDADAPVKSNNAIWKTRLVSFGAGWAAGALGGAFGTSGPPLIAYVYSRHWTKERRTATLQALFLLNALAAATLFYSSSLYTQEVLLTGAISLPGACLGALVGYAIFKRIPAKGLEIFVAVFLTIIALKLFIWP